MTELPELKTQTYALSCVDVIIENDNDEILIEKSNIEPTKGKWILPGGYVRFRDNNVEAAVIRSVHENINLDIELTHLVDVSGDPDVKPAVDPRFFGVQMIYRAVPKVGSNVHIPTDRVKEVMWVKPGSMPWKQIGYNHRQMIKNYIDKKKDNQLIAVERRIYTDKFDTYVNYKCKNYMHTVVMGIVLNENNEILLGYRGQEPFKEHWDFPGGHMYAHESIEECLKREVGEELGVDCNVGNLFHVYSDRGMSPRFARAMILYFIDLKSQKFVKNIELVDFKFFSLDELPDNIAYHCEGVLEDIRDFIVKNK